MPAPKSSILAALLLLSLMLINSTGVPVMSQDDHIVRVVNLPAPVLDGTMSVEECLASRRSVREYGNRALTLHEVSQILWAAQGITSERGGRTAPSAGAKYPVVLYMVAGNVEGLGAGVWVYNPSSHSISLGVDNDIQRELKSAALDQSCIGDAQVVLVITAIPSITEARYGDRSMRYIDQEVGSICQNVYLQCESLGLGTVAVGAFDDARVKRVIGAESEPRLIMPVGTL